MPGGKSAFSRSIVARTLFDSASAFDPGDWNTAIAAASLLFSRLRSEYEPAESSTRPRSRMRIRPPVAGSLRTMMSANCSSLVRRPCVLTASWNSVPRGDGGAPTVPAATCAFCSRTAATTSPVVMLRAASLAGSSQMRMA